MFYGIGTTLVRLLGPGPVRVLPHPSSVSLACARLGWPVEEVAVVSAGRPAGRAGARRALAPGPPAAGARRRRDAAGARSPPCSPRAGYGASRLTVLEQLGGPSETRCRARAAGWPHAPGDPLNVLAVECRATRAPVPLPTVPGLPDDAYEHDGQLTKREVRARRPWPGWRPAPGELLWDVGAGAGIDRHRVDAQPTRPAARSRSSARRTGPRGSPRNAAGSASPACRW